MRIISLKTFVGCFILFFSINSFAKDKILTFSYWSEASPPFVFLDSQDKQNIDHGIIKELALLISSQLNATPHFINIPVQRTESQLIDGAIDLNCITNPIWKKKPNEYHWSPALFDGADRFLVKSENKHSLAKFSDLKGKVLGVYNGYSYHPTVMKMIEEATLTTVKITGINQGIKLLLLDRIDALIDFDILLNYRINKGYEESLALADLYAGRYALFCAYSKKMQLQFKKETIDQAFKDLISQGKISELVNRFN